MTKRRPKGEGNIYQRADGRWAARISAGYQGGKRTRRWVYGETRADVVKELRALLHAQQEGNLPAPGRVTVEQFLTRWLDDCAKPKLRPRTFASYAQVIHLHVFPTLGRITLQKLTPQHVQNWLNERHRSGLSARSCQYARAILRAALAQALRWGNVTRNVAALVEPPRVVTKEVRPLTPEHARQLLAHVDGKPLQGFVAVGLGCGLRLGEALGLKWEDVDLETGTLHVRQALQRTGGDPIRRRPLLVERRRLLRAIKEGSQAEAQALQEELTKVRKELRAVKTSVQLVEPKSARSRRTIALPAVTVAALRKHRTRQLEARLAAGKGWRDEKFVFTTPCGGPADPHNLHKDFKTLLKDAKLPPSRIHDLRHSCASLLLAQGVDARTIMGVLGHSQIALTMNVYAHVLPTLQRDAAERMNRLLMG